MPLIDLKTTLKDLKFDTKAPYIVKDINNPPVYNSLGNQATRRQDDVLRLTRMLTDVPGAKFVSNQVLLQAYNSANFRKASDSLLAQVAAILGNTLISTGRAAAITLAQAGIEGSGARLTLPQPSSFYYTQGNPGSSTAIFGSEIANERGTQTVFSSRNSKYARLQEDLIDGVDNYIDARTNQFALKIPTDASNNAKARQSIFVKGEGTYYFGGTNKSDQINLLDVGRELEEDNDLYTKVVFAKYNSKGTYEGTKLFRGFIGNISDTFTAKWNANEYVGRMEQFFVYTGFTRALSFPLQVPIFSKVEQPIVYNKVNSLISHTAPQYTGGTGIPSGIVTYLEVGDYYKGPGVLNTVGVSISNDVQWSPGPALFNGRSLVLPQVLSLNISFTPIHEATPQATFDKFADVATSEYNKFRYIGNGDSLTDPTIPELSATEAFFGEEEEGDFQFVDVIQETELSFPEAEFGEQEEGDFEFKVAVPRKQRSGYNQQARVWERKTYNT
jgi:hypothetical protein